MTKSILSAVLIAFLLFFLFSGGFEFLAGLAAGIFGLFIGLIGGLIGLVAGLLGALLGIGVAVFSLALPLIIIFLIIWGFAALVRAV